MMGRLKNEQGRLFYEFHLSDAVPEDHLVRKIDAALDLSGLRSELVPHYSSMGRPSIDPELMIRMLVVGYVFALRSERLICREVRVNLAYRWFCKLGIVDAIPDAGLASWLADNGTERHSCAYTCLAVKSAIARAWITMHPSGTYLMFTQAGANLFRVDRDTAI
jgi:hypothetical protein